MFLNQYGGYVPGNIDIGEYAKQEGENDQEWQARVQALIKKEQEGDSGEGESSEWEVGQQNPETGKVYGGKDPTTGEDIWTFPTGVSEDDTWDKDKGIFIPKSGFHSEEGTGSFYVDVPDKTTNTIIRHRFQTQDEATAFSNNYYASQKEELSDQWEAIEGDSNWEFQPSTGKKRPTEAYIAQQKQAGYDWDSENEKWLPITKEARDATIYAATEAARVRRPERLAEAEASLEAAKKGIVDDTLKIKDPLEVGGYKKNPDGTLQMYPVGHEKAGQPVPVVKDLTVDEFDQDKLVKAGYLKNADGTLKLNEAGEPITISADTVTGPTVDTAGTASTASIAADTKTAASGHQTYTADQLKTTTASISEAIGSLDDQSLAAAVGVSNVGEITKTSVDVPEGALVAVVTGALTDNAYATAAKVTGTSLPRITRAKTQLRNAGLTEDQITAIGNDPESLEAELENLTEEERGIIAGLPKEALVTTQLAALLQGIEDGEIPAFARPAVSAIEQMLAVRGLSASTVGRDNLVNGLIQSAIPLAQANAEALQASVGQQKSIDAAIALKEAEFRQEAGMQKAQAVFSLDMAQFDEARTREIANSKFFQTIGLTEASFDQESYVKNAVLLSQENLAQADVDQKRAIQHAQAFLSLDMANLTNEHAARILEANFEQERLLSNQAAQNASLQFNAKSKAQTNQFMASLESEIARFNTGQINLQDQFNSTQTNLVNAQNADRTADINKFNAQLFYTDSRV